MNRRSFLGWFGASAGTLAIYKELPANAVDAKSWADRQGRETIDKVTPSNQFVIKNEGQEPYVVHYARYDRRDGPVWAGGTIVGRQQSHVSAILLPGEELTITAVPMQIPCPAERE